MNRNYGKNSLRLGNLYQSHLCEYPDHPTVTPSTTLVAVASHHGTHILDDKITMQVTFLQQISAPLQQSSSPVNHYHATV